MPWNKGLTKETDERVAKYSNALKAPRIIIKCLNCNREFIIKTTEKNRKFCSQSCSMKHRWQNPIYKESTSKAMSLGRIGIEFTNEHKKHLSEVLTKRKFSKDHCKHIGLAVKKNWQDMIWAEKQTKLIIKGLYRRPTSLDNQMINIINRNKLPYMYTGDGSFLIGWKNPDFVNTNGQKICVEVRNTRVCEHFEKISFEQYKQKRIDHFNKYGWRCLVFNENDLKNENEVIKSLTTIL